MNAICSLEVQSLDEAERILFGEADLLMLNKTMGGSIEKLLALVPFKEDRTDQIESSTSTKIFALSSQSEKPDRAGKPERHVQMQERNKVHYPEVLRILKGNSKASPSLLFSDPYFAISKVKLSSCSD